MGFRRNELESITWFGFSAIWILDGGTFFLDLLEHKHEGHLLRTTKKCGG